MSLLERLLFVTGGSVAIIVMAVDFFTTTLSLGGTTGMLTARLSEAVWKLALRTRRRRVLEATGPIMLLIIAFVWLLLAAIGWTLLFRGLQPAATGGGGETAWFDLILSFFDTFLGIGNAQLRENAPQWQVLRRLMVLHGIATLSLSLAWILPVVRAVAQKRAVALRIAALGNDSQDILVRAWNGEDFGDLNLFLIEMSAELSILGQMHIAYPVLHYYHSTDDRSSLSRQVTVLDETVSLLADHVAPEAQPDTTSLSAVRAVLTDFLGMLESTFIPRYEGELPPRDTDRLEQVGIPLRDDPADRSEERRRLLIGYVQHDGMTGDEASRGDRPERHRALLPDVVSHHDHDDAVADPHEERSDNPPSDPARDASGRDGTTH